MASHKCAFCKETFQLNASTYRDQHITFDNQAVHWMEFNDPYAIGASGGCLLKFFKCPNQKCERVSIYFEGLDPFNKKTKKWIFPDYLVVELPNYVPEHIRQDFNEACKILELSPKASATLSRRVLQSMIRDFYKVTNLRTLHAEIEFIKDKIEPEEYDALMALKSIGNIGAHSEKNIDVIIDVEPEEAHQLVELIQLFVEDWYTKRAKKQVRLSKVKAIGENKEALKNVLLSSTTDTDQQ